MTLTDFLLARLAEDEAATIQNRDKPTWPDVWSDEHIRRALADVEAKRRIVKDSLIRPRSQDAFGYVTAMDYVMANLAAVYSDHPDYDEAWSA